MKRVEGVVLERHPFGEPGDDGEYPCVVEVVGEIRFNDLEGAAGLKQRWWPRREREAKNR